MARADTLCESGLKRAAVVAPFPTHVEPMLATLATKLPHDQDRYAFEWKWDGVRAITFLENKHIRIESRNLIDVTHQYPEMQALAKSLRCRTAVLDGEIISLDENGMPSFKRLQRRMHIASPATALRLSGEFPAWYMLFDLLYLNGKSLMRLPYHERRQRLERLVPEGPSWRVPEHVVGDGTAMLDGARRTGMEGIVAKELDSTYAPGRRSRCWLKLKVIQDQEFVVGGYVPESTGRAKRIGSLLLGYYDGAGLLQYAGRVGTGLSGPDHAMLLGLLQPHLRPSSPFASDPAKMRPGRWGHSVGAVSYVDPAVIVQVEYRRWPEGSQVQQASYKGVRTDKNARNVVKETA